VVARWGSGGVCCGFICCDSSSELGASIQLLKTMHQQEFNSASGEKFRVTFSGGIAEYPENGMEALYRSAGATLIGPRRREGIGHVTDLILPSVPQ